LNTTFWQILEFVKIYALDSMCFLGRGKNFGWTNYSRGVRQISAKLFTNNGGVQASAGGDKFRHKFLVIEGTNFGSILSKTY
jgi:hypothetical protein